MRIRLSQSANFDCYVFFDEDGKSYKLTASEKDIYVKDEVGYYLLKKYPQLLEKVEEEEKKKQATDYNNKMILTKDKQTK